MVQATDMNNLRTMADELKQKLQSVIIVLGSAQGDKVNLIAAVTKDYIDQGYHAGKLLKEVAAICGGGGGGRPDMAQAGGKNPAKLNEALSFVEEWVKSISIINLSSVQCMYPWKPVRKYGTLKRSAGHEFV